MAFHVASRALSTYRSYIDIVHGLKRRTLLKHCGRFDVLYVARLLKQPSRLMLQAIQPIQFVVSVLRHRRIYSSC